ncbi:hypothetical protein PENTCL1PPCAC_8929, partial [Pristionchus entomophagus]
TVSSAILNEVFSTGTVDLLEILILRGADDSIGVETAEEKTFSMMLGRTGEVVIRRGDPVDEAGETSRGSVLALFLPLPFLSSELLD